MLGVLFSLLCVLVLVFDISIIQWCFRYISSIIIYYIGNYIFYTICVIWAFSNYFVNLFMLAENKLKDLDQINVGAIFNFDIHQVVNFLQPHTNIKNYILYVFFVVWKIKAIYIFRILSNLYYRYIKHINKILHRKKSAPMWNTLCT